MRRTLIVIALVAALCTLGFRASPARALGPTGTCAVTSYTLTGGFNRVGGATTFHLSASGSCVGAAPVAVDINYSSIGPWSCDAGAAHGVGAMTSGSVSPVVDSYLVNVGGEYVIEMTSATPTTIAAGEFTTLPIQCDLGVTQATVDGTGTLTFTA